MSSKPPHWIGNRCGEPPGRCIYCDATDGLTNEHIVAQGLNGRQFLPDASCDACRKITGEFTGFEGTVQRDMLRPLRKEMKMRSKKRPLETEIPVTLVHEDGREEKVSLAPAEIPFRAALPMFSRPGVMLASTVAEQMTMREHTLVLVTHEASAEKLRKRGVVGNQLDYPIGDFARMLAKIAHCMAVAIFGIDGFHPVLRGIIRGHEVEYWPRFIGSGDQPLPASENSNRAHLILPTVREDGGRWYIVMLIWLFIPLRLPPYEVVTGWLDEVPEWIRKAGSPP